MVVVDDDDDTFLDEAAEEDEFTNLEVIELFCEKRESKITALYDICHMSRYCQEDSTHDRPS